MLLYTAAQSAAFSTHVCVCMCVCITSASVATEKHPLCRGLTFLPFRLRFFEFFVPLFGMTLPQHCH